MLYVLRCYMSCDVICLYQKNKKQKTKNKKQKTKNKKKKVERIICIVLSSFLFLPCIFCHSFLHFVTHFYKNGKVNKTRETRI